MSRPAELIDLQSCNANQMTVSGVKEDWLIKKNISGEVMQVFPANINDQTMFCFLDFAKKYELIAFNQGIKFQKGKDNPVLIEQINILKMNNQQLAEENSRLADILDAQTKKDT